MVTTMRLFVVLMFWLNLASIASLHAQSDVWQQADGPYGGKTEIIKRDFSGKLLAIAERGMIISSDDGHSWNTHVLRDYKILWITPTPWGEYYVGTSADRIGKNIMRSSDGGTTWTPLTTASFAKQSPPLLAAADGRLYAYSQRVIYRSDDRGETWTSIMTQAYGALLLPDGTLRALLATKVVRSTNHGDTWEDVIHIYGELITADAGRLYMRVIDTLHSSTDNGNTWEISARPVPSSIKSIMYYKGGLIGLHLSGTTTTVVRSQDDGKTWSEIGATPRLFQTLAIAAGGDLLACATTGIYRSNDTGISWQLSSQGYIGSPVLSLSIASTGIMSAKTPNANHLNNISLDTGSTWIPVPQPDARATVVDREGKIFVHTAQAIFQSSDSGRSWIDITDGIDVRAKTGLFPVQWGLYNFPGGDVCFCTNSEIYFRRENGWERKPHFNSAYNNCVPDAVDRTGAMYSIVSDTYEGSDRFTRMRGQLFRSSDGGKNWTMIRGHEKLRLSLELNPPAAIMIDDNDHIYLKMVHDAIFLSKDYGATWTTLADLSDSLNIITSFARDSSHRFYLGSYSGVFWSLNRGVTWYSLNEGLADLQVQKLAVAPGGRLIAGTTSAGIFTLQPPTPLAALRVDPGELIFSDQTPTMQTVQLASVGNIPIRIDSIVSSHPSFIVQDRGTQWVPPGSMLPVAVTFSPRGPSQEGVIRIYSTAPTSPDVVPVSGTASTWLGVRENPPAPFSGLLSLPLPNPAHGTIGVTITMPAAGRATLDMIDYLGNTVALLLDEHLPSGERAFQFNTSQGTLAGIADGLYFLRLRGEGAMQVRQIMLAR